LKIQDEFRRAAARLLEAIQPLAGSGEKVVLLGESLIHASGRSALRFRQ